MSQFKKDERVYVLYQNRGRNRRAYGRVVRTRSNGRVVDVRFDEADPTWSYQVADVHRTDEEPRREAIDHVLC